MCFSPTPHPFKITFCLGLKSLLFDSITVPEKSTPGIIGYFLKIGIFPLIARPSLKLKLLKDTFTITFPLSKESILIVLTPILLSFSTTKALKLLFAIIKVS